MEKLLSKGSFFCRESIIFSVPISLDLPESGFQIICKGQDLDNDSMVTYRTDKQIIINGLPIFDLNSDDLPFNYLEELFRRLGISIDEKVILSKIINYNISIRNTISKELRCINSKTASLLKDSIEYEIKNLKNFD